MSWVPAVVGELRKENLEDSAAEMEKGFVVRNSVIVSEQSPLLHGTQFTALEYGVKQKQNQKGYERRV